MRRRRQVQDVVEAVQEVEAFVHSSRRASLDAVLAEYNRDEPVTAPSGFRSRSRTIAGKESAKST